MVSEAFAEQKKGLPLFTYRDAGGGLHHIDNDLVHILNAFNQIPFVGSTHSCSGTERDHYHRSGYQKVNLYCGAIGGKDYYRPHYGAAIEFTADDTHGEYEQFKDELLAVDGVVIGDALFDKTKWPTIWGDIYFEVPEAIVRDPTSDVRRFNDMLTNVLYRFLLEYNKRMGNPQKEHPPYGKKREPFRRRVYQSIEDYKYYVFDQDYQLIPGLIMGQIGSLNIDVHYPVHALTAIAFTCPTDFRSGTMRDTGAPGHVVFSFPEGDCNGFIELKADEKRFPELKNVLVGLEGVEVFDLDEPAAYGLCTKRIHVTVPADQQDNPLWLVNFWDDFYFTLWQRNEQDWSHRFSNENGVPFK